MKTGFSTNAFFKKSLLYAIDSISNFGYDGVEIVLDTPHAFLPMTQKNLHDVKNCIKENKIQVTNLNANTVEGWYKKDQIIERARILRSLQ